MELIFQVNPLGHTHLQSTNHLIFHVEPWPWLPWPPPNSSLHGIPKAPAMTSSTSSPRQLRRLQPPWKRVSPANCELIGGVNPSETWDDYPNMRKNKTCSSPRTSNYEGLTLGWWTCEPVSPKQNSMMDPTCLKGWWSFCVFQEKYFGVCFDRQPRAVLALTRVWLMNHHHFPFLTAWLKIFVGKRQRWEFDITIIESQSPPRYQWHDHVFQTSLSYHIQTCPTCFKGAL